MPCRSKPRAKACASRALPGLPTYHRANAQMQFLVVNGRPVRDKLLIGAVRGAYADFLARDRHPALALFLDCDPGFRRRERASGQDGSALSRCGARARPDRLRRSKHALAAAGHRASTTVAGRCACGAPSALRARHAPSIRGRRAAWRKRRPQFHAPLFSGNAAPAALGARGRGAATRSRGDCRWVLRARNCTRPISWRRPRTASSSSTSTPRMNGSSMSA